MMKNQTKIKLNLFKSMALIVLMTLPFLSSCGSKPVTSTPMIFAPTSTIVPTPTTQKIIDPNMWINIGPWADAQSVSFDPQYPGTVYIWTPSQMIRTTDEGDNWEAFQSLQNIDGFFYIDNMLIDPLNPATVYAVQGLLANTGELSSTGELFKSIDGGINWQDLGIEIEIGAIAINPENPDIIYVGSDSRGILKSSDGGNNWVDVNNGLAKAEGDNYGAILDLAIDPQTPTIIYAATNKAEIYKSTDDGANWQGINLGVVTTFVKVIGIDQSDPATIYAATENEGIVKSTNSGNSWGIINNGLTDTNIISLALDPLVSGTIYAGTVNSGIFKSTDGGNNWSEVFTPTTSVELFCFQGIKEIAIDPVNPATVFALTGGQLGKFVLKSTDGGAKWDILIPDMFAGLVGSIAISPEEPTTIYAGTRAGVLKSLNGGGKWSSTDLIDDITSMLLDPADPGILYAISASDIYRTTDQGGSWNKLTPAGYSYSITGISTGPADAVIIYAMDFETRTISMSTDRGATWSHTGFEKFLTTPFDILLIDPLTPTTLYAGSPADGVYKSLDSGKTWQSINPALVALQTLDIDPKTSTILYAGTENEGVLKSMDAGATWQPINNGLDNLSIQAFVIDPGTPATLYVSTLSGVFKSVDGGGTWESFNTHLPNMNTSITSLIIDPVTPDTLYAGTYLQGIYVITQEK
jgi:photosystem II stability/assembly factor-like uncharacterized protein